jgi:hypothetical protein
MAVRFDIYQKKLYVDGVKFMKDCESSVEIGSPKDIEKALKEFKRVGVITNYNMDYFKE